MELIFFLSILYMINKYIILVLFVILIINFKKVEMFSNQPVDRNYFKYSLESYLPEGYKLIKIKKNKTKNKELLLKLNKMESELNYLTYKKTDLFEGLKNIINRKINNIYRSDVDSIKNLSRISEKLKKNELNIPGNLKIHGKLSYKK